MKNAIEYYFVIAVRVFVDDFGWNGPFNSSLFQCMSVEQFSVFVFSLVSLSVLSSFLTTGLLCS